tara:strand:+ start:487 stop:1359 length:873 start_codon:yes stop_codon:yes gene_type:complete
MATDFLNVIERALMMGVSDTVNTLIDNTTDMANAHVDKYNVHVFGEFPEVSDLKFPAIVVEHTGSGFEEQFMGQDVSLGTVSGTGETYGASYTLHIILDQDSYVKVKTSNAGVTGKKYTATTLSGITVQNDSTLNAIEVGMLPSETALEVQTITSGSTTLAVDDLIKVGGETMKITDITDTAGDGQFTPAVLTVIREFDGTSAVNYTQGSAISILSSGTPDVIYRQRRLLNWLMLNVANAVMDINFDIYEEEDTQVIERHLNSWQSVGFIPDLQWYGASADFSITFTNIR